VGRMAPSRNETAKPMSSQPAADDGPFSNLIVKGAIRARVDFIQSLWTDESKFEQIVASGRYLQLCLITEQIYDRLSAELVAV
jgi:hypothetical protein